MKLLVEINNYLLHKQLNVDPVTIFFFLNNGKLFIINSIP